MIKLLADENVERSIVVELSKKGFNVDYIREISPGISDDEVIRLANKKKAILLTSDKDFGELVFRMKRVTQGVIFTNSRSII